jgi:hypothetical protein
MFKYNSVPAYSFGKSQKADNKLDIPGPGTYDMSKVSQLIYKGEPTTAVIRPGSSRPVPKVTDVGPGQYEVDVAPKKVKGYYFTGSDKNGRGNASQQPGPGQYDFENSLVKLKEKDRNIVFGRSTRIDHSEKMKKLMPGPGQYDVESMAPGTEKFKHNSGYKFTKSTKDKGFSNAGAPGPGAYDSDVVTALCNQGKGYSLSKSIQRPDSGTQFVPGPGTYAVPQIKNSIGSKFGKDSRRGFAKITDVPGPGIYEISSNPPSFKNAPGIKFGKGESKF